ncbi:MAG: dodecin family protein [Planctomycetota bacterium]
MSVAKVIELSATSKKSFDNAVENGVKKAAESIRNIKGVWVKEMSADVEDGKISSYRVNIQLTFVLDD